MSEEKKKKLYGALQLETKKPMNSCIAPKTKSTFKTFKILLIIFCINHCMLHKCIIHIKSEYKCALQPVMCKKVITST